MQHSKIYKLVIKGTLKFNIQDDNFILQYVYGNVLFIIKIIV